MERETLPAEIAWLGLVGYVSVVDSYLLATGKAPMTDAWRKALKHPLNRWVIILAWIFTTKHLFFGNIFPKVDPFRALVVMARALNKIIEG
jgi:hypothetical protein